MSNRIQINDRVTYAITKREYTDEGFLRVPGRVARVGNQDYLAGELGLPGNPNRLVTVHRPPEEVFDQASLDTYQGADITIEHPKGMVNCDTYKKVSVGVSLDAGKQDGDFVLCNLIVKDTGGIKAIEQGKVQLSVGYTALYDDKVPEGADYEYIQREIRVNHIALVDRARAGAQAKLYDNQLRKKVMALITLDSGNSIEIEDASAAQLINDTVSRSIKRAEDAEADLVKAEDAKDKMEAEKDEMAEELEEEKLKSSDAAINHLVAGLLKVKSDAVKVAGSDFTTDSISEIEIKRMALAGLHPTKDWDDRTDAYIVASFDIELEKSGDEKLAIQGGTNDSHKKLAVDAAARQAQNGGARQKAVDSMSDSWKKTVGGNV